MYKSIKLPEFDDCGYALGRQGKAVQEISGIWIWAKTHQTTEGDRHIQIRKS